MNAPARPLPALTLDNTPFWTGGARGALLIQQCEACSFYIHPPTGFCPSCESRRTRYKPVSGHAEIVTFTINHKAWFPNLKTLYVLALVALAEQPDVRLATNIEGCAPEDVFIGMPVRVFFEQAGDIWVPLFKPVAP